MIPEQVSIGIIGILKIIKIYHHHPTGSIGVFLIQVFIDQLPSKKLIIQHGQRIPLGSPLQYGLFMFLRGNIPDQQRKPPGKIHPIHGKHFYLHSVSRIMPLQPHLYLLPDLSQKEISYFPAVIWMDMALLLQRLQIIRYLPLT